MEYICTFLISFMFIFFSELGDKTQILVLSFSTKNKTIDILLGVALGTFLSHGIAIILGGQIGLLGNPFVLKLITYIAFLLFGILGFLKWNLFNFSPKLFLNKAFLGCIGMVALSIAIGELGDKTLLASVGLGLEYSHYKFSLILGAIAGMVASNSIAIFFGKLIGKKLSSDKIQIFSNLLFIVFGITGLITLFI